MKKLIPLILVIPFVFYCCKNNTVESEQNNEQELVNDLLPVKVQMHQLVHFDKSYDLEEAQIDIDYKSYFDKIFEEVLSGRMKAYDPDVSYDNFIFMSMEDLKRKCGESIDTFLIEDPVTFEYTQKIVRNEMKRDEMNALFFTENWFYNKDKNTFKKEVSALDIVRKYVGFAGIDEKESKLMAKTFSLRYNDPERLIKDSDTDSLVLFAENIVNEYDFTTPEVYYKNLDREAFWKMLREKMDAGTIKMTDFYDNNLELKYNELVQYDDFFIDTFMVEDPVTFELQQKIVQHDLFWEDITSFLFIEDWYYDKNNFKIIKTVKGLAPVATRKFSADPNNPEKKILFTLWFDQL